MLDSRTAFTLANRPIIVAGNLRWLFGYRPTRGAVPFGGFFLQVAGFLIFACNLLLSLLVPQVDLSIVVGLTLPFCMVFAYWLAECIAQPGVQLTRPAAEARRQFRPLSLRLVARGSRRGRWADSKHLSTEPMDIMRKLTQQRLTNARKPTGRLGRLLIRAMNISHYRLTNWGLSHLSIRKQDTILDIGCGGGGTVHKLAKIATNGKVYGIDFSDESVMVSRMTNKQFVQMGRVEIQHSSVSCLPFSDNKFDLVTAVNTHNYWPDLVTDMQEILRVLNPSGKLIIIGSVYEGGKYDKRNQKYAELIEIAFPSVNVLHDLFLRAGYSEVQMFEKYNRSWICGIGRKPL